MSNEAVTDKATPIAKNGASKSAESAPEKAEKGVEQPSAKVSGPNPQARLFLLREQIKVTWERNIRPLNVPWVEKLATSIAVGGGLDTPLGIIETSPGVFELNEGYHRTAALDLLKWSKPIPVMISPFKDVVSALMRNTKENSGRQDVRPIDYARRFHLLTRTHKVEPKAIAAETTLDKGYINNLAACIERLDPTIIAYWDDPENVIEGGIGTPHRLLPAAAVIAWKSKSHAEQRALFTLWLEGKPSEQEDILDNGDGEADPKGNKKGRKGKDAKEPKRVTASALAKKQTELSERLRETPDKDKDTILQIKSFQMALNWVALKRKSL